MDTNKKQTTLTPKSMTRPYTETEHTQHGTERKYLIRTFSEDVEGRELVWHRDKTTRQVHVLMGSELVRAARIFPCCGSPVTRLTSQSGSGLL